MSVYDFYYDETEHSRKINYKTLNAENYYDNFVTMILGCPSEDKELIQRFLDFEAKYELDTDIRFSKFPKFLKNMIKEIAKKSFEVLKCEGYANIDFIVKDEQIYVLEVNTVPGFTDKSILPRGLRLSDIKISDFIDYLINFSLS